MSLAGSSTTVSWMTLAATRPCTGVSNAPLYPNVSSQLNSPDVPVPLTSAGAEICTGVMAIGLRTLWPPAPSLHVSEPNVHSSKTASALLVNVTVYDAVSPGATVSTGGSTSTFTPSGASTATS